MAVDEQLAARVRAMLKDQKSLQEKTMFGGLAFLLEGHMCCGVHRRELIVRVEPARHEECLAKPNTREFDLSGRRAIRGWLLVTEKGCLSERDLRSWVDEGLHFVLSLPPKKKKVGK